MEKILRIEETTFEPKSKDVYSMCDGFQIITDKQTIRLGISNEQNCCENWGYFMSEDDLKTFEGASIVDITITDTALKTEKLPEYGLGSGDTMFVNINTDKGLLQFTAYNAHNGYYGHSAVIESEQLTDKKYL